MSKKYNKKEDFAGISDMLEGRHHVIPIMAGEDGDMGENVVIPEVLPILTLRSSVLFPGSITPITVGRDKSMKLVREVESGGSILGAVLQNSPQLSELYHLWQRCSEENNVHRGVALVILCALLGERNFKMLAETCDVIELLNENF